MFVLKNSSAAVGGVSDGIGQLKMVGTGHIHRAQIPVGNVVFRAVVGLGQAPFSHLHIHRSICGELDFLFSVLARDLCLIFDSAAGCRSCGLVSNGIFVCVIIHI